VGQGVAAPLPERIAGRYRVLDELGRGGMGVVYRVEDGDRPEPLALKQLLLRRDGARNQLATELFEREFHTLAQLAHPRVIKVHDYGVDADGPFYTMELLDGGDLRTLAPLDYRRACALMLEVCSSLALLHSRRLVHRDISPRNVRCTRDGHAKLIDFGAMVPMGPCSQTVGTPAFIAPEVLHHLSLDARTDLFSLGGTLYYALTGRQPFVARELGDLRHAWSRQPVPPSLLVPDVPPALDALCASLLRIDPAQRPGSAFEVMHRLQVIAGIEHSEPLGVSAAYLATPMLVGRDALLRTFRRHMRQALHSSGGALCFEGAPGLGRSRLLDACVLEAKTLGALVLRADAGDGAATPFASARRLAEQLLQVLPDLARANAQDTPVAAWLAAGPTGPSAAPVAAGEHAQLQAALSQWILRACEAHAFLIAVDDVHAIDEATLALLASLALQARDRRLMLVVTTPLGAQPLAAQAFDVLRGQCARETLPALGRELTEALFVSVFGHVAHVALLSDRLHTISGGNPRDALALAQHLVGTGLIRYERGQWALPAELESRDLPASATEAFAARLAALPELARRLAEAQALSGRSAFRRDDYALLAPEADASQLEHALGALLAHEIVHCEGGWYSLAHRAFAEALVDQLTAEQQQARHLALAEVLRQRPETHPYVVVRHLLAAGSHVQALDFLAENAERIDTSDREEALRGDPQVVAATLEQALGLALSLRRPAREAHNQRHRLCLVAVFADDELHQRAAPAWLEQLELDSGLRDYRALDPALDAGARLGMALQAAAARYEQTPERERVYRVDEAIKLLATYVVTSIVIASRTMDVRLARSLPGILEPFVALSPLLHALWQNAIATYELMSLARGRSAAQRWVKVYEQLGSVQGAGMDQQFVDAIRSAIAYAIATFNALLGREAAFQWLELLDHDPVQRVNAMRLRRYTALMRGEGERAERYRQQAELLAVQTSARQMFARDLRMELLVSRGARDLAGVKNALDGMRPLAARHPGWAPLVHQAQGHFESLRGDHVAACAAYERCRELTSPGDPDRPHCLDVWIDATAGLLQALCALERAAEAVELGERTLEVCHGLGVEVMLDMIGQALAVAEAKLGRHEAAGQRVDTLIAEQRAFGVSGPGLAVIYETRARIAILARDASAAAHYAGLALRERPAREALAGGEIARLLHDARGAGIDLALEHSSMEASVLGTSVATPINPHAERVRQAMVPCATSAERAECALTLLCEIAEAPSGRLYLLDDSGALKLAASLHAAPPDAESTAFARNFFARQLDDHEMTAGPTEATHMLSLPGAATFVDGSGSEHRLLVLSCREGAELVYVGLAVLRGSSSARVDPEILVLTVALASHLLSIRDSRGARTHAAHAG
jgi:hypothetical protein